MKECLMEIRVRASDTDFTGAVANSRYFEWFSAGRIEYYRMCGLFKVQKGHLEVKGSKRDTMFVVRKLSCEYYAPCRFDDLLELATTVKEVTDKSVLFEFNLHRKRDKRLMARGYCTHVYIDLNKFETIPIPEEIKEALTGTSSQSKYNVTS